MKKLFALLLALTLVFSLAATAAAEETTYSLTIDGSQNGHTYTAYQIFDGDLAGGTTESPALILSNIVWGDGVSDAGKTALLSFGKGEGEVAYADAAALAAALSEDNVKNFAKAVSSNLGTAAGSVKATGDDAQITGLAAGYYLVTDSFSGTGAQDSALSAYMIKVVGNVTATSKHAKPTVDKQVLDETADAEADATNGWGETADHAINESFQFKLIATLSKDDDYAAYETYKVIFTDTMSAGVTFENVVSVTVDGLTLSTNDYVCSAKDGDAGTTWTLIIDDIKGITKMVEGVETKVNLTDGAVIEVIYNAHLNENAVIGNDDSNINKVKLTYSNNPNASGSGNNETGETPWDTVFVFTYNVNSTKYANSVADNNKLAGAGFTLYTAAEYAKLNDNDETTTATPVSLVKGNDGYYYPSTVTGSITEMTTGADGVFNVKGLDVGTYYLVETTVPAGYNKCDDITIVISATHSEAESEDTASTTITMKKDQDAAVSAEGFVNAVINKSGTELPETGGMGTTLFYIVGGIMVAAAVVLLVTKKRMGAEA